MTTHHPEFLWLLLIALPLTAAHLYRIRRQKMVVPYLRFWEEELGQERWRSLWARLKDAGLWLLNMTILFLITAAWGMISQLLFIWNVELPPPAMQFLARSVHPLWWLYAGGLAVVLLTVLLPVHLFFQSNKLSLLIQEFTERLSVLTIFYLLFDLAGLVIVIIRNI